MNILAALLLLLPAATTTTPVVTEAFVPLAIPHRQQQIQNAAFPLQVHHRRQFLSQLFVASTTKSLVPPSNATDSLLSDKKLRKELAVTKSLRETLNIDDDAHPLPMPPPLVVGHRGAPYLEMENTMQSFQRCQQLGCDAVELDVFSLKCGTLVVFHGSGTDENPGLLDGYIQSDNNDNNNQDVLGGKGILDFTYDEIVQQHWIFTSDNPEFPCPPEKIQLATIPTLEQVLSNVKTRNKRSKQQMHVTMELKGGYDLAKNVLSLVDKLDMRQQTSCSSFNMKYLQQVRDLRPERDENTGEYLYQTGALFNDLNAEMQGDDVIQQAKAVGATEVHLRYDTCTAQLIDKLHQNDFVTMAWFRGPVGMAYDSTSKYLDVGNEDEDMYEVVWRSGVQKLCVNKPNVLLGLQKKIREKTKQQSSLLV